MTTFPMGGAPGALCPTCSYPHFPFCMRHPANASALPPQMPVAFPPSLPSRAPGRPTIHSPQVASHLPSLGPPAMASYQPSPPLRQSFPGRGTIGEVIPNGGGVPLIGRGSNASTGLLVHAGQNTGRFIDGALNSDSIQFGGSPFHNQAAEPFQNPLPPHSSNSMLSTPSNHRPPSVEHFPGPLNPPTLSGSPHTGLLANPRPPGNGWSDENERDNLLREKGPSMPQWFLDQQRRSGSKGVPPNGRSGIGELLRGEEIAPGATVMNQGRLELDRQGIFKSEDAEEAQRSGYRYREDVPSKFPERDGPRLFHRMDVPGNGGLTDSGMERKIGPPGLLARFEGVVEDRERRLWGIDTPRDSSLEQGFSSHTLGHASYVDERRGGSAAPSFGRDAVGGGLQYQMGRRERAEEGIWSQQSSREEQLLHEHGLVDDGVVSSPEGAEVHWEGHAHVPGRGHFALEGPDGTAQRRLHTEGEHMSAAKGTEMTLAYHSRQQVGPVNADKLHGAGNLVPPERSAVNGERPYFESSGSGLGLRGPASNVDISQYGGQSGCSSNTPPAQEELDELYYLKHFPQPNDNQARTSHPSVAPPRLPHLTSNQARTRDDGPPLQEALALVASQDWGNEQQPAGVQNTGHLQQSDREHRQQPAQSHESDRSPQAHRIQASHLSFRNNFHQDAPLPVKNYSQHQASSLHVQKRESELSKQPAAVQPSHTQHISNGQRTVQPSQPTHLLQQQQHHHQHEHLHHGPHLMQTLASHLAHQHMQPLPQNQGPLPHQMQQQGQAGQPHPPRFYLNTQGSYQSFNGEEASVNGRTSESGPITTQASMPPSIAHQHPAPSLEAPPLPLNAADTPPPPPPSPPHYQPPPHSPPMAPPPPPLPPPLPPSPPPNQSGLNHVPAVSFSVTFPGHPHSLNMEEPVHRMNYFHPTHALPQSLPAVLQGSGFQSMGPRYMHQFGELRNHGQLFPQKLPQQQEKSKVVDAVSIFRRPGRLNRPDRIVVILRGLPGSGKSYLAKALRDVELMNGGTAPRIHSIDDYFMTEVEGEEAGLTTSNAVRSKKRIIKKVMEYCYEPEMEELYRGSMLKAFRKTLEEGMFSFIIVDDRNVLVDDFAQFWAIAKRSGYEVYLLEPPYRDPAGCAARNVHNFKLDQIQDMAKRWEPAPSMYLQLDVSSLFRGDDLNAQDITEVEMDTDDMEREGDEQEQEYQPIEHRLSSSEPSGENDGKPATTGDRWEDSDGEAEESVKPAKRMRLSEVPKTNSDSSGSSSAEGSGNDALSGLMQAYGKREKTVRWADHQDEKDGGRGFTIGSALAKISDLVIGPGPGYNKESNPLQTEDCRLHEENEHLNQSTKFLEQYRAEQDAFKAVFAMRRQGGAGLDDEDGAV